MKDKLLSFLVLPSIMFALFLAFSPVGRVEAVPAPTCPPTGGDWVKVEPLSGLSYEYTAPEGKLVAESCYKVGSHNPEYQVYASTSSFVTVTSTLFNSPGGAICTEVGVPNGCNYQALSHASFRLIDDPGTEIDMCEWDETIPADDDDCQEPEGEVCEWDETIPADDDDCQEPDEDMCEWDETIPADDDDCQEPDEDMCEWDETILAEDENCNPPVVSCVETFNGPIVWGKWIVDPNDSTMEYQEGQYTKYDVNDPSKSCGVGNVDPNRREITSEGEVLGAEDDNTGVVLAATGPTDNIVVYIVELLLVAILVTYSVFFTKTYLKNSK